MDFLVKDLIKPNYYPSLDDNKFNKEIIEGTKKSKYQFNTLIELFCIFNIFLVSYYPFTITIVFSQLLFLILIQKYILFYF